LSCRELKPIFFKATDLFFLFYTSGTLVRIADKPRDRPSTLDAQVTDRRSTDMPDFRRSIVAS
jgi:hypothetical protein